MNYSFASTNNKKPDKTPLILDQVGPPKTRPGFRAIFFDGQWQIVPTTGGVTIGGRSGGPQGTFKSSAGGGASRTTVGRGGTSGNTSVGGGG